MQTITERVAEIRRELKAQFPELKLSVKKEITMEQTLQYLKLLQITI